MIQNYLKRFVSGFCSFSENGKEIEANNGDLCGIRTRDLLRDREIC
jgi:hypothetical protein